MTYWSVNDAEGASVLRELPDFDIGYNVAHSDTDHLQEAEQLQCVFLHLRVLRRAGTLGRAPSA